MTLEILIEETDRHDITEILLKLALNITNQNKLIFKIWNTKLIFTNNHALWWYHRHV